MAITKSPEPEKTPEVAEDSSPKATAPDTLTIHQKSLREQLMTQWPNNNWEIREE